MKTIGLFEAKTRLSELCREVASSGESILIERRGVPIAELSPPGRAARASNPYAALGIADAIAAFEQVNGSAAVEFPEVWNERTPPKPNPLEE